MYSIYFRLFDARQSRIYKWNSGKKQILVFENDTSEDAIKRFEIANAVY